MGNVVYLDYAATTPVDPAVVDAMVGHLGSDGVFGNPASRTHGPGREAAMAVERAREHVASLINANPPEIIWTSGATESINLALKGVAYACADRGRHIVTSRLEHSAVLGTCRYLNREGFEITLLSPDQDGLVSPDSVAEALRDDTVLVSLMHVNNEVGTVTDIAAIGALVCERGIAFHVDAAQGAARLPLDVHLVNADFVSLSGHKMYGPKGVGALYVRARSRVPIVPQIHGGDQEQGLRAGTLATHQVVGMGEAARLIRDQRESDVRTIARLEQRMLEQLVGIEHVALNGNQVRRVPGIMNVSFACVDSESLMLSLRDDVALSTGSACTSSHMESSHVLLELGLSEEWADCSVRISLGRFTADHEIDIATSRLREAVAELRALSSRWSSYKRAATVASSDTLLVAA